MKLTTTLVGVLILAAPLSSSEATVPDYPPLPEFEVFGTPPSEADGHAVEQLMEQFSDAWNTQDIETLLAVYAEDAEWTNAFGLVQRGHGALRETFNWLFDRFPAPANPDEDETSDGTHEADANAEADEPQFPRRLSLRYLGPTAAVIHSVTESTWGDSVDGSGKRRVHVVHVLEKKPDGWRIAHQQIMDVRR